MVFRRELIDLLRGRMLGLSEIARIERARRDELLEDLGHVEKTLRREGLRLLVEPARCRKCGYTFPRRKISKPGHCPECRSTWIEEPRIGIEERPK